jgi:hypothetical protein
VFTKGFKTTQWGDWGYLPHTGSDHKTIYFKATTEEDLVLDPISRFNLKKTDWEKFRAILLQQQIHTRESRSLEERTKDLEDLIFKVIEGSTPYLKINRSRSKL